MPQTSTVWICTVYHHFHYWTGHNWVIFRSTPKNHVKSYNYILYHYISSYTHKYTAKSPVYPIKSCNINIVWSTATPPRCWWWFLCITAGSTPHCPSFPGRLPVGRRAIRVVQDHVKPSSTHDLELPLLDASCFYCSPLNSWAAQSKELERQFEDPFCWRNSGQLQAMTSTCRAGFTYLSFLAVGTSCGWFVVNGPRLNVSQRLKTFAFDGSRISFDICAGLVCF